MDNLDYTKICSEFYSNSEDGCCFECCEFLNHDECPVGYVQGLLEEKDNVIEELKEWNIKVETEHEEMIEEYDKRIAELQQEQILEMKEHQEAMKVADKKIADLEAKLAEKEEQLKEEIEEKHSIRKALRACHHQNDEFADMIKKLVSEKEKLKQQLAEKDNEITQRLVIQERDYDQDKISFVLEQLEKVKNRIESKVKNIEKRLDDLNIKIVCESTSRELITYEETVKIINNQIKRLKEMK